MYAVVESGGKQYKVEEGTSLLVDRLDAKDGDKVALRPVLFRDGEVIVGAKDLAKVKVEAKVTEHLRGQKDQSLQIQGEEGLPQTCRPSLRADQARGDQPQRRERRLEKSRRRKAAAKAEKEDS